MTNNEHTLIKKKENPCNTGFHFLTRNAKQYVSYANDLIQALDPEHVTFSYKNNHRNISNERYLEWIQNWLHKSSCQQLPEKLEGRTKWYSTRTNSGCLLLSNFSSESGDREKSASLLHLQIILSRKGVKGLLKEAERLGIVQPGEDFGETLYHLLIPKGVTREPEWDFWERDLVLGQEVVNLSWE